MSVLEIISLVSDVSTAVGDIHEKYQQVQRCKTQCWILAKNIMSIHEPLRNFYAALGERRDKDGELKKTLNKLLTIIRDVQDVISKHSNVGSFEKVFLSNKFKDEFNSINQRLRDIKKVFNIVMDIELAGNVNESVIDMDNACIAVEEEMGNAVKEAEKSAATAIEDVQKAISTRVFEIPTIEDNEIVLNAQPESLSRALGMLNKLRPIELSYNKDIVEDKPKLETIWKLSSCEGILTIYGLYKYKDTLYLVTERINPDCLTLDLLIKRKTFYRNWGVIRSMSLQLVNAIGFMHRCKILHRGIRSSNICIVGDRYVRICDFVYPRYIDDDEFMYWESREQIKWTAPERLKVPRPDYDEKCDTYSLGAVIWSLLTHKVPFDGVDPEEICDAVLKMPEDIPKEFTVIIEGCMDRDREKRWTIEKMIDELSKLIPENLEDN